MRPYLSSLRLMSFGREDPSVYSSFTIPPGNWPCLESLVGEGQNTAKPASPHMVHESTPSHEGVPGEDASPACEGGPCPAALSLAPAYSLAMFTLL